MGLPLDFIRQMPEKDLQVYWQYYQLYGLPSFRAEAYAAQNALVTAKVMGGYKGGLSDFLLFQPKEKTVKKYQNQSSKMKEVVIDEELFADFNPANV